MTWARKATVALVDLVEQGILTDTQAAQCLVSMGLAEGLDPEQCVWLVSEAARCARIRDRLLGDPEYLYDLLDFDVPVRGSLVDAADAHAESFDVNFEWYLDKLSTSSESVAA